jgi:hypothetical protein
MLSTAIMDLEDEKAHGRETSDRCSVSVRYRTEHHEGISGEYRES